MPTVTYRTRRFASPDAAIDYISESTKAPYVQLVGFETLPEATLGLTLSSRMAHKGAKPIGSLIVSWETDDPITSYDALVYVREFADRLGIERAVIAVHDDSPQPHVHLLFDRATPRGYLFERAGSISTILAVRDELDRERGMTSPRSATRRKARREWTVETWTGQRSLASWLSMQLDDAPRLPEALAKALVAQRMRATPKGKGYLLATDDGRIRIPARAVPALTNAQAGWTASDHARFVEVLQGQQEFLLAQPHPYAVAIANDELKIPAAERDPRYVTWRKLRIAGRMPKGYGYAIRRGLMTDSTTPEDRNERPGTPQAPRPTTVIPPRQTSEQIAAFFLDETPVVPATGESPSENILTPNATSTETPSQDAQHDREHNTTWTSPEPTWDEVTNEFSRLSESGQAITTYATVANALYTRWSYAIKSGTLHLPERDTTSPAYVDVRNEVQRLSAIAKKRDPMAELVKHADVAVDLKERGYSLHHRFVKQRPQGRSTNAVANTIAPDIKGRLNAGAVANGNHNATFTDDLFDEPHGQRHDGDEPSPFDAHQEASLRDREVVRQLMDRPPTALGDVDAATPFDQYLHAWISSLDGQNPPMDKQSIAELAVATRRQARTSHALRRALEATQGEHRLDRDAAHALRVATRAHDEATTALLSAEVLLGNAHNGLLTGRMTDYLATTLPRPFAQRILNRLLAYDSLERVDSRPLLSRALRDTTVIERHEVDQVTKERLSHVVLTTTDQSPYSAIITERASFNFGQHGSWNQAKDDDTHARASDHRDSILDAALIQASRVNQSVVISGESAFVDDALQRAAILGIRVATQGLSQQQKQAYENYQQSARDARTHVAQTPLLAARTEATPQDLEQACAQHAQRSTLADAQLGAIGLPRDYTVAARLDHSDALQWMINVTLVSLDTEAAIVGLVPQGNFEGDDDRALQPGATLTIAGVHPTERTAVVNIESDPQPKRSDQERVRENVQVMTQGR